MKFTQTKTNMNTCEHQYEVSSPIDTVEVCIKCGHRIGCEPQIQDRFPKTKTLPTHTVRIHLSGPIEVAKQVIREFCLRGLCVTIEPTLFIYTGGEETGYVVGLVNYPRFPKYAHEIDKTAHELAEKLIEATHQHSALIVSRSKTTWITSRDHSP